MPPAPWGCRNYGNYEKIFFPGAGGSWDEGKGKQANRWTTSSSERKKVAEESNLMRCVNNNKSTLKVTFTSSSARYRWTPRGWIFFRFAIHIFPLNFHHPRWCCERQNVNIVDKINTSSARSFPSITRRPRRTKRICRNKLLEALFGCTMKRREIR